MSHDVFMVAKELKEICKHTETLNIVKINAVSHVSMFDTFHCCEDILDLWAQQSFNTEKKTCHE